jgi:PLD-like domain
MARPEWDIALICDEIGIAPEDLCELLRKRDGKKLRRFNKTKLRISKDQWESILAAAKASGIITEISDSSKPPEERIWRVSDNALEPFARDLGLMLDILPDARRRFSSSLSYRIAATIPEELYELKGFFRAFENTALGLRRMISQTNSDLTILVPFMDSEGLSEILPSLHRALERGVKLSILTRELGEGRRNITVLSSLVDAAKRNAWNIELFEAVMPNEAPISHAKVFSKDNGDEVYIGSANLTLASMEKTIEIGVFLKGKETQPINEFLSMVKTISQKRWP